MLDFSFLFRPATLGFGESNLQIMIWGWGNTVAAFVAAIALALALGVPLGVARTLPDRPVAKSTIRAYVEIFRNIPLIVQLFLWFFVLPEVVPTPLGHWLKRGLPDPEYWTLVVALGIYMSARIVEITRAGIQSLGRGQIEAAHALGLSMLSTYRDVLLPQALRVVMPPLTTEFTNCFKATSVGLTIGYIELTQRTREISEQTFRTFEIFAVATLAYLLSVLVLATILLQVERSLRIPGADLSARKP